MLLLILRNDDFILNEEVTFLSSHCVEQIKNESISMTKIPEVVQTSGEIFFIDGAEPSAVVYFT
jgi:hypothetical protein